uniref:Centromere protein O n=1 Tax=Gasterosteus aculeatus aculeatus TaxID=481459 RepID=A0AAQ4PHA5_GASAC|nr:centromere protein O [Gasterosteus aculeatus aculeatus]
MTLQPPKSNTSATTSGCFHLKQRNVHYSTQHKYSQNMEVATTKGVLSHLSRLEVQKRSLKSQPQQPGGVKALRATVEALLTQRDQLRAEIQTHKNIKKLRVSMDKQCTNEEEETEEGMDEDSENSNLLRLMARHTQLKDLLHAHNVVGGYNVVKTRQGKGVCVSVATFYEGVYLNTYNLEIDVKPTVRISRHNVPPFIPLNNLAEQSNMQTDLRTLLDPLSQHLNAFAGRQQQFKFVKELHKSVEVMESNVLCSLLVLKFTVPREKTAVLCSLDYTDCTRSLPTRVHFESDDEELPESPVWKTHCSFLMETPVHKALKTMRKTGNIV